VNLVPDSRRTVCCNEANRPAGAPARPLPDAVGTMDATRWQRLEELFLAALECDDAKRRSLLEGAARDDPALAAEVEAMLAAHADPHRLALESHLLHDDEEDARALARQPGAGSELGPYRLVEEIGRGGMGVVYRAVRADGQYDQTVAVKLLRGGFVTPELVSRFRSERQILARLEHPAIARLLDGGVTADGLPYLVMEHVEGRPITAHCDAGRLTIDERLALFTVVCAAVNHAHRNLVVHRDLKPSNILVTADGAVKLLDFGIARLIDSAAVAGDTRTLQPVMTPEFASPEQLLGGPITTATDVYALGLLLYELLCGERAQRTGSASLAALQRSVIERHPQPPSEALVAADHALVAERVAARGLARADRLRRQLRGDLDTIVAKAIRKEPERRYASVEQLAGDIDRHRRRLPVHARPDTFAYRARRFVRRHALGFGAAAAVLVSMLAGLAIALSGLNRARSAERIALDEAAAATHVSDFLVDLFRATDPTEARGDTVTARQLLDRGAARVATQLEEQPVVRARLLRTMAQAYESLGLYDAALPLLEEEHRIHAGHAGPESPEVAAVLRSMSGVHGRRGDYDRARELADRAVAIQERAGESGDLAAALNSLGSAHGRLGELAEAKRALERSLAVAERVLGVDHPSLAWTLNNLAIVHWQQGDAAAAGAIFARAIGILEQEHGAGHPLIAPLLNNQALAYSQAGQRDLAIATHTRVLGIREAVLAADHPDIGETLNNLGVVLLANREFGRARDHFERALAIRERSLGAGHEHVGSTLSNLGFAYLGLAEFDSAHSLFERSAVILEAVLGAGHAALSYPEFGLARVAEGRGDAVAAEQAFRRAIAIREARMPGHPDLADAFAGFATFLRGTGREAEADSVTARADAILAGRAGGG
jgi:eukaryotic-like serine/threonine-protein kinase